MTLLASSVVDNNSSQLARPDVVALFISDLHLQSEMPATTEVFLRFLSSAARHAKQLYLLGDIFEYWAGDDDLESPFAQKICHALREVSNAGVAVFWIAGNPDCCLGKLFEDLSLGPFDSFETCHKVLRVSTSSIRRRIVLVKPIILIREVSCSRKSSPGSRCLLF